jgi:hypothetical protein
MQGQLKWKPKKPQHYCRTLFDSLVCRVIFATCRANAEYLSTACSELDTIPEPVTTHILYYVVSLSLKL